MLKFISIGIHLMDVQIAWLLTSTYSKKSYVYLAEIWDMLLLLRMCQSEISYHDATFTLERRGKKLSQVIWVAAHSPARNA